MTTSDETDDRYAAMRVGVAAIERRPSSRSSHRPSQRAVERARQSSRRNGQAMLSLCLSGWPSQVARLPWHRWPRSAWTGSSDRPRRAQWQCSRCALAIVDTPALLQPGTRPRETQRCSPQRRQRWAIDHRLGDCGARRRAASSLVSAPTSVWARPRGAVSRLLGGELATALHGPRNEPASGRAILASEADRNSLRLAERVCWAVRTAELGCRNAEASVGFVGIGQPSRIDLDSAFDAVRDGRALQ